MKRNAIIKSASVLPNSSGGYIKTEIGANARYRSFTAKEKWKK